MTLPRTPTTRLSRNGGGTRPGHTAEEKRYARAEQKRAGEEEERPGEIAIGLLEHANDGRTGEPAEIADRVDEGEACCGAGSGEGGSPCGRRRWRKPGEWDRTSDGRSSFARRATVASAFDPAELPHGHRSETLPPASLAALPLIVVVGVNFLMSIVVLPRLDTTFLAEERWGGTSLAGVGGIWAVVVALAAAILILVLTNLKRLPALARA